MLEKPQPKTQVAYDWHECAEFINEKYGINIRDYAGKYSNPGDKSMPYLDFWHWIVDHYDVHNGSYFHFDREDLKLEQEESCIAPWQGDIYQKFIDEFGDENGYIKFFVEW